MTQDDPTRPDLDAALDAVVPSLTAVSDDAVVASLRRTRVALADDGARQRPGSGAWRWAVVTATAATAMVGVALWQSPPLAPTQVAVSASRPSLPAVPIRSTPVSATSDATTPEAAPEARRSGRQPSSIIAPPARVAPRPTAAGAPEPRRADPLLAVTQAVQAIPDEAWDRGEAASQSSVQVPRVVVADIVITPLTTPPVTEWPAEVPSPGEP